MANYRALVVDDSSTMRQLLSLALRRVPGLAECDEASNGAEALELLSNGHYDVVLADINMPVMNGLELIDRMRSDDNLRAIPVVMITTEGSEEAQSEGLARGAAAYLPKPVTAPKVVSIVGRVLSGSA